MIRHILGAALALAVSATAAAACASLESDRAARQDLLAAVNQTRAEAGLPPLAWSRSLDRVAEGHACDMARRDYFDHQSPDGGTLKSRLKNGGYRVRTAVENIAYTRRGDPDTVMRIWRESPGHMANILNRRLAEVGFGISADDGRILWVMVGGAAR